MAEHNDLGQKGEQLACDFLRKKGYQILETNWYHGKAEIDIIAENDEFVVIVEVKTRSTNYFGEPEVFVDRQKQRHLIKAANAYALQHDIDKEIRFDIIAVLMGGNAHKIHHIDDAFYPLL